MSNEGLLDWSTASPSACPMLNCGRAVPLYPYLSGLRPHAKLSLGVRRQYPDVASSQRAVFAQWVKAVVYLPKPADATPDHPQSRRGKMSKCVC